MYPVCLRHYHERRHLYKKHRGGTRPSREQVFLHPRMNHAPAFDTKLNHYYHMTRGLDSDSDWTVRRVEPQQQKGWSREPDRSEVR